MYTVTQTVFVSIPSVVETKTNEIPVATGGNPKTDGFKKDSYYF